MHDHVTTMAARNLNNGRTPAVPILIFTRLTAGVGATFVLDLPLQPESRSAPGREFPDPAMKPSAMDLFPRKCRWLRRAWPAGIGWLYFLLLPCGFALDPARDILQYNCRTWSRQSGLPVNGVNAIAQTRDGYLWLGTSMGLVRFDGNEFRLLDLARVREVRNSTVTSLAAASGGGLWVGLDNSAFGFCDGQSFSFRGKESWGGAGMNVHTVLEDETGTLWFAAGQAARLTPSGDYEALTLNPSTNFVVNVLCNYEDSRGRIWFGAAYSGAYYWQTGKVTHLIDPTVENSPVNCVAEDREGQIWLGTDKGLKCYGPDLRRREMPPLSAEVRSLLVDRHGVLWIGTSGRGLVRYQRGDYQFLGRMDGLAGDYVNALAEDREGSLWVGTRDGLSLITDVKFATCPAAENPTIKDAWAVAASRRGGVWIGSRAGITYFDGKPKTYSTEAGLPNNYVKRIFEASNGDVYLVSGNSDLVILSGGKVVAQHDLGTNGMVVGITEDAQGVVVSINGALYRASTNGFKPYAFTNGEPPMYWILNLTTGRDGAIWASTINGFFRIQDGVFRQWTIPPGNADAAVQWICEDSDGVVWGAQLTGITRLKDNQVRCISRKDGLFDNNIYAIVSDNFGNLWVDSARGIFRVARQNLNDFAEGRTHHVECVSYDGSESVQSPDKSPVQEHVGCKTPDGRIWFPSAKGVVMIDPAHIPTNRVAPPVYVDRVLANGRELAVGKTVVVPPGRGELEFHFTALSFIAPEKVRFRYQLEGYDDDWVEVKDRRMAFYTNLKPGHYTFRVIAANADGVWNQAGDSQQIELRPHFYQTAWFDVLCGGLICAALAGLYAGRVRHLTHKHQALQKARDLLETQVQHRTAELARANTSLQHEVEVRKRAEEALEKSAQELQERNDELGRFTYTASHDLKSPLVTIKAFLTYLESDTRHHDTAAVKKDLEFIYGAVEKMGQLLDELLHLARVGHKMNPPEEVPLQVLVKEVLGLVAGSIAGRGVEVVVTKEPVMLFGDRMRLMEVFQNLVDNAIKFMGDQKKPCVEIGVETAGAETVFFVRDNGMGIEPRYQPKVFGLFEKYDPGVKGTGIGLALVKRIVEVHGGKIWVESAGIGHGATFRFTLAKTPPHPAQP